MTDHGYEIPNDDAVSPEDIHPEADLWDADLSGADLGIADLSGADLTRADLSEAALPAADLSEAGLIETILSGVTLPRTTDIDPPGEQIGQFLADADNISEEQGADVIARASHELKTAYSENGLVGKARKARVRERAARRRESLTAARSEASVAAQWPGITAWVRSALSSVFTGYGVKLRPVIGWMLLLFVVSAGVYYGEGLSMERSLYYGVVTFTTAPPISPLELGFRRAAIIVAGVETFAGTAAIIFIGYVLGTRGRV